MTGSGVEKSGEIRDSSRRAAMRLRDILDGAAGQAP